MSSNEDRRKHLEFLQAIINRHNSNSFMLKGWAITIAAALFALAGTVRESEIFIISILLTVLFWGLDAYYLSNERCLIDLYSAIVKANYRLPNRPAYKQSFKPDDTNSTKLEIADYDLNFQVFRVWKDNRWSVVLKSKTIISLYLSLIVISGLLFLVIGEKSESITSDNTRTTINNTITLEDEKELNMVNFNEKDSTSLLQDTLATEKPF